MKVFMVHGSFGSPYTHWTPWLKTELEKNKIPLVVPSFPTPTNQNYTAWSELLNYYLKQDLITEDTVFVAHSCGCICIARFLAEHNVKCRGLITVAGYNNFFEDNSPMRDLNITFYVDSDKLCNIKTNVSHRVNFYGSNDPFIPKKYFEEFSNAIGAKTIIVENGGHLNSYSGFETFPELLEQIIYCNE